jgi:hypothetical protein
MKARSGAIVLFLTGTLIGASLARATDRVVSSHALVNPDDPAVAEIRRLGERTISQVGVALVAEVRRVLAHTPPAEAIGVLHLKDYKLPVPTPGKMGVTAFRRVTLHVRNPANSPDDADQAALLFIERQLESGDDVAKVLVQRVTSPGQPPEWRVYRPVSVLKECLQCHGENNSLAPGVDARLKELYPVDTATAYNLGDWRGLIRVTIVDPAGSK